MWSYQKRLQYPVRIQNTNPRLAQYIVAQYGGANGNCLSDGKKGCGLIQRKRQGQGRPSRIYVMKFTSQNTENDDSLNTNADTADDYADIKAHRPQTNFVCGRCVITDTSPYMPADK